MGEFTTEKAGTPAKSCTNLKCAGWSFLHHFNHELTRIGTNRGEMLAKEKLH